MGIVDALHLIQAEYREMPGLSLTLPQAMRFWGLDEVMCRSLLETLVTTRFLTVTPSGIYRRANDGPAVSGGQRAAARRPDTTDAAPKAAGVMPEQHYLPAVAPT